MHSSRPARQRTPSARGMAFLPSSLSQTFLARGVEPTTHGVGPAHGPRAAGEHDLEVGQGSGEVRGGEEDPPDDHDDHGVEMLEDGGQALDILAQDQFLDEQEHAVIEPPEVEVPAGPVPEARERPDDEDIHALADLPAAVAAQGDVDVIPEPGGQGDVPAPPELGHALGDIGVIEVDAELEAQHPAQAAK